LVRGSKADTSDGGGKKGFRAERKFFAWRSEHGLREKKTLRPQEKRKIPRGNTDEKNLAKFAAHSGERSSA